ncbi:hypothetical protein [Desmospora activa]|uniref:PH (Pleckstrin Homology) domain-containing protein n=1 Tax=Desmospora activa DSM 45169 TaxID=1121389 RepID=A0A2T4ZDP3_9BACL|nr:hypothetical protein [Desmospora activa]PTM60005.1 hypothetical protein C8J48_2644 [Desmospora activa DSM 45169]
MPFSDFIQVKSMEGELIISQKRNQLGCTLTTKELIFQKPHTSYQIMLSDTLGLIPFRLKRPTPLWEIVGDSAVRPRFPQHYYRISAHRIRVINRNGSYERGPTDLLVPLNDRFIQQLQQLDTFAAITT